MLANLGTVNGLSLTPILIPGDIMEGESREERFAEVFGKMAPSILIVSLLITVITASVLVPLPEFTTDLSSFAPENDAKDAEERMNLVMTDTPNRIYVHVTPNEDGANVLEIGCLLYTSPSPRDMRRSRMPSSA